MATVDPSTLLLTSTRKFGDLRGRDEHDHEWGLLEYGSVEASAFVEMAHRGELAMGVSDSPRQGGAPSRRVSEFMVPHYGYRHEMRVLFRDRGQVWGAMAIFRADARDAFDEGEIALLADLSASLSVGVRVGLLTGIAPLDAVAPRGPGVVIVDGQNRIQQVSAGTEERLAMLMTHDDGVLPDGIIGSLVSAARRFAAGDSPRPPRCRVRARDGMWLVLHATTMSSRDGSVGDVVVTIDEARPPEIVPLVVAAFDLTPRERMVTELVLQGVDTKEIATTMHLSTYTVQDHLKSVFTKADVRSRRELIARIYFDQYVPRLGTDIGPTGWFAEV